MARAFNSINEILKVAGVESKPTGYTPIFGEGEFEPELMVVRQYPSWADNKHKKPLVGQEGLPVRKALVNMNVSYYATNAFPFFTNGGKVGVKEARQWAGVLSEEIRRVNPQRVVVLGADAARWTVDFSVPFRKHSEVLGRTFEIEGRPWRVVHSPGAIANSPTVFQEFLRSLQELLYPQAPDEIPTRGEKYSLIRLPGIARTIIKSLPQRASLDVETDGLDPYTCKLLMVQVSGVEGEGYGFPWDIMSPQEWASVLGGKKWIFQNGAFDTKVLAANGVFLSVEEDTMLMHSLVDETPGTHSLEEMSRKYLGEEKWADTVDYSNMESVPLLTLARYGARDTDLTLRLANQFRPLVQNRYITRVLHDAQNAIIRSEIRGVKVDREKAQQFSDEIEGHLHDLQQRMEDVYGLRNANSPKQVLSVLQDMGVPLKKVKGSYSTAEAALEGFEVEFPLVADILEYRHLTKARSTYLNNILIFSENDGRYHPEYRLAATETGRLAERLITLVPRADGVEGADLGRQYQYRLRELFIPDDGYVMIGADYSGLELAMAGYLSKDPALIDDITQGRDTHSILAIQAFGLPVELEPHNTLKQRVSERYSHQRTLAKQLTFGYLFGSSGMSMTKFMSLDDAVQLIDTLKRRYPRLSAWQEETKREARTGIIETPWGRHRHFYYSTALADAVNEKQDREAINFKIQAMASDMTLAAFTRLENMGYETLFPVHDAIYLQVREDEVEEASRTVLNTMSNVLTDVLPFRADLHVGRSWKEL